MQFSIIDSHVHMDVRSANDYELMAVSGVKVVIVPSTYTGEKRSSKEAYFQYYDRLLGLERKRAESFGIKLYVAVSVDPEDLHDTSIAYGAIEGLPKYFENKSVCAIGEIGLEKFTSDEISIFKKQLDLANRHKMPIIMHTPHQDKETNLPKMLKILKESIREYSIDEKLLLLDDLTVDTIKNAWELELGGYGIAISPQLNGLFIMHKKASPGEVKALIDQYGTDKIIFNSALAWGFGDALAISRVLLHLKMIGVSETDLRKLAYENAKQFFSQNPNFVVE